MKKTLSILAICFLLSTIALAKSEKEKITPDKVVTYKTVTAKDGSKDDLELHIFEPEGHKASDKTPAIVFFFGGGWKGGKPTHFYPQSDHLSSRGMVATCVEYRTATSHGTEPKECVKDGKSAMRWVRRNAGKLGIDPNMLAAGGGSAGGHVAAACGSVKGFNEEGEDTSVSCRPDALVLFNPVYDNSAEGYGHERVGAYWKEFSPMHNIDKDTPPTVVFLGTKDKLIPVATAEKYKELMEKAGVRNDLHLYKDQPHGFFNKAKYEETLQEADKFLVSLGYLKKKLNTEKLGFNEIVFVKRKPYSSNHYYTDIGNGTSPDRFLPENGIYIYNLNTKKQRPVITAAQMPGGKGLIGKANLSFDAKKVIFDFRETPFAGFRIWEVNIDGSNLRQISFPPPDEKEKSARWITPQSTPEVKATWPQSWANSHETSDIHPTYLPDGGIMFVSTRSEGTVLCGSSGSLVVTNMHRMDADGTNVEQLSYGPLNEFCPEVLDDGRVMYHRWEYVDRASLTPKMIWSMNPDGTKPQELYGLSESTSTCYMYPRQMPGEGNKIVCVGTSHYPQGGCLGAIMIIDLHKRNQGREPDPDQGDYVRFDDRYAAANITPHVFIKRHREPGWEFRQADGKYKRDGKGTSGHLYTHPFPVSETEFLVSYKVRDEDHYQDVPDAYALYLLDIEGSHTPVLKDEKLSCWHPIPLKARKIPPQINTFLNEKLKESNEALCSLTNIYDGMEGVEKGEIKWLRINETVPRYWATGRNWWNAQRYGSEKWKAALWPRVQWGIVPVEADGSAYFKVPAGRNLFFEALDKNFMEVQRERTFVNYKAGEIRSCTGCHGNFGHTAGLVTTGRPIAISRPPSTPEPMPCDMVENGGDGKTGQVIHYPADVQPLFDAKCISCHSGEEPKGALMLTGDVTEMYSKSYEELLKKQLAGHVLWEHTFYPELTKDKSFYKGRMDGAQPRKPKSFGSHDSVMLKMLRDPDHPKNAKEDHSKKLTKNELMRLTRWVDSNYQFHGTYYGRQHIMWKDADPNEPSYDPADFRREPTFEEAISPRAPKWHK